MKKLFFAALALSWASIVSAANPQLEIKTSQGAITVELFADKAPKTTANFLKYAKEGFYNGTVFHRVINRFMIQGGGFTPDMNEKTTHAPIENEAPAASVAGLRNATGTLAMARTGNPHSATAQFFINTKDNPSLDYPNPDGWGYAVFGKVTKGMDVVFKISAVQTTNKSGFSDVPVTPIVIESVTILPEKK